MRHLGRVMARHHEERKAGKLPDFRESHEAVLLAAASLLLEMDPRGEDGRTDAVQSYLRERASQAAAGGAPHWLTPEYEFQNGPESKPTQSPTPKR